MPSQLSPVGHFFLRVVLWMPVLFLVWFYMAIVMAWPITWLANLSLPTLLPGFITGVDQDGYMIDVVTRFQTGAQAGQIGEIIVSVNPLMYGYGVPLFTALLLATPEGDEGDKWFRWLIAIAILLVVQTFGVSMDAMKTITFGLGPEYASQIALEQWQMELLALGYQLGYLVLPAVAPIALWIGFHRRYIDQLAPGLAERLGGKG
jgi:hypothetical protein